MDVSRTAPSLTPVEAEGFFAEGCDARPAAPGSQPGSLPEPERCWIIQRCTQKWVGTELLYEDFWTNSGRMTRTEASLELRSVEASLPGEFRAHRISRHCDLSRCAGHIALRDRLFGIVEVCNQGSPVRSGGTGAAGKTESLVGAGGPANQADGFAGGVRSDCPHCGPVCYGGAAHNVRVEDGVFYGAGRGELPAAESGLRCAECGNFRHASPRHKPHCRYAGSNCPGCMYASQEHIASCAMATQFKLPTDTCCDGVDLPGAVAPVHAPDCPNPRPVARASVTYNPGVARPALASRGTVRAYVSLGELSVGVYGNYVQVSLNDRWTSYLLTPTLARELANLALLAATGIGVNGGGR